MGHPLIQSYANTLAHTFPLILVIGREPNTDLPITTDHGHYDFRAYPNCGFWNIAYSTVARTVQLTTGQFKQRCQDDNGAPIIFADALPIGLKQAVGNKQVYRAALSPEAITQHIARLFAYQPLISRVRLVMTAGLYRPTFDVAITQIEAQCQERAIAYRHLPFFFGTNSPKIQAVLTDSDRAAIRQIIAQFLPSHPKAAPQVTLV